MIRSILNLIILTSFTIVSFMSCDKDTNDKGGTPTGANGTFIVNEGAFGNSNATISFLNSGTDQLSNDYFLDANSYPLGDVAQSMYIKGDRGYIVVNNSQKVEVVNRNTCTSIATITGFSGPRYFIAGETKGYVSDWFDNDVKVIDLGSNTITGTIPTGAGPEQMIIVNSYLFVANVGGWGSDSTVTVIDTGTDSVVSTLTVGMNPNSIALADDGSLYVLCGGSVGPDFTGGTADDIAGSIWQVDPSQLLINDSQTFMQSDHPSKLNYDKENNRMYFLLGSDGYNGAIKYFTPGPLPVTLVQLDARKFYGLGVAPSGDVIYGGLAPGFTQKGYIFRFNLNGSLIDSMKVGVAPNGFAFSR